ncbi:MAG: hypothetical protein HGA97_12095 [Chlorobiaceae bacterium]|nr:hypothetical protein [Chlorobiaceae bacterium]
MSHELITIAEPVQNGLLIGTALVSLIVGFWAMLNGRGCETEHRYYEGL